MTDVMWYMMILGILMPPFLVGFNLLNILDRDKQSVRSRKRLRRRSFSFRVYLFGLSVTITLDFILNYNFIPWVFFCFVFVLLSLCLFFYIYFCVIYLFTKDGNGKYFILYFYPCHLDQLLSLSFCFMRTKAMYIQFLWLLLLLLPPYYFSLYYFYSFFVHIVCFLQVKGDVTSMLLTGLGFADGMWE